MSAPPYMKLYVADYRADTGHFTTVEHGAYLLLLGELWLDGAVSADDEHLARCTRSSLKEWLAIKPTIMEFFFVRLGKLRLRPRFICHVDQPEDRREYNPLWIALRAAVLERDGYTCTYCGDTDGPFEADHVLPVARGGEDSLDNLVCACRPCNRSKGALLLADWLATR